MIRDRITAATIEGALAAAVTCPAFFLMDQQFGDRALALTTWLAVAFALAPLTLAIRALTQKRPAPEHRRKGLHLRGTGCHTCRWMRFWWPLAAAPAGTAASLVTDIWGLAALGLALTGLHLTTALSALAEDKEPHWAARTGFRFER